MRAQWRVLRSGAILRLKAVFVKAQNVLALAALVSAATLIAPAARADITYDYKSFSFGGVRYELTFIEPDFLSTTTIIPFADLTVITEPSPCSITGFTVTNPFSASVSLRVSTTGSNSCAAVTTANFSGPFNADGTYSNGALAPSILTISGSPATSPVPEPASVFLFGGIAGAVGLTVRRRAVSARADSNHPA